MTDFKEKPIPLSSLVSQYIDLTEHFQNLIAVILKNPEKVWQMQLNYLEDALSLAQAQFNYWLEGKPLPINDQRFNGEDWINNPFLTC